MRPHEFQKKDLFGYFPRKLNCAIKATQLVPDSIIFNENIVLILRYGIFHQPLSRTCLKRKHGDTEN